MNRNAIYETVVRYVVEQLGLSGADAVNEKTDFVKDLKADSADLMMLVMDLEAEFGMTVEDEAISSIHTIGDIVEYISGRQ